MQNYTSQPASPQQLPLFDPYEEAALYQPPNGGYFALLTAQPSGAKHQRLYPVDQMETVLGLIDPKRDSWISQAQFWSARRRILNVKTLSLTFLDVDYYKRDYDWCRNRTPEQVAQAFKALCAAEGIPEPSIIVHSGRGIQPKWLYDKPLPGRAIPRWNAVENQLIERLGPYGVDSAARDAARVLRVVRTVNSRSGDICRVVDVTPGDDGKPIRYNFEELCDNILPHGRPDKRGREAAQAAAQACRHAAVHNGFDAHSLAWDRMEDMRTLCRLRGGISEGMRMNFLMYCMCFMALSDQVTTKDFYHEALVLARDIDPEWSYRDGELQTVYAKMKQFLKGERVVFNGRTYVPVYTPRSETLINLFEITNDEMAHLKTIVSDDVRRERNTAAQIRLRRAKGMLSREDYLAQADARKKMAVELRKTGLSIRAIAEKMEVSAGAVSGYLKGFVL